MNGNASDRLVAEAIQPYGGERIVCIRPGALGDTLLTLPTLALLRRARPTAQVLFVARRDVAALALASGLAAAISAYDLPCWSTLFAAPDATATSTAHGRDESLRLLRDATVIAWLADDDGQVARTLVGLGATSVIIASPPVLALPAADKPERNAPTIHTALALASALAPLGIAPPQDLEALLDALPPLRPSAEEQRNAAQVSDALRAAAGCAGPLVALHPGSGGAAKRWQPANFALLALHLRAAGLVPVLLAGPQDAPVLAEVEAAASAQEVAAAQSAQRGKLLVAPSLPLGTLAALLPQCHAYVGNDSGVTHLAAMVGTPTLALFGPSDPAEWAPLGRRARVLRAPTWRMRDLAPANVIAALATLSTAAL